MANEPQDETPQDAPPPEDRRPDEPGVEKKGLLAKIADAVHAIDFNRGPFG
jgi:hypothetical protein